MSKEKPKGWRLCSMGDELGAIQIISSSQESVAGHRITNFYRFEEYKNDWQDVPYVENTWGINYSERSTHEYQHLWACCVAARFGHFFSFRFDDD